MIAETQVQETRDIMLLFLRRMQGYADDERIEIGPIPYLSIVEAGNIRWFASPRSNTLVAYQGNTLLGEWRLEVAE